MEEPRDVVVANVNRSQSVVHSSEKFLDRLRRISMAENRKRRRISSLSEAPGSPLLPAGKSHRFPYKKTGKSSSLIRAGADVRFRIRCASRAAKSGRHFAERAFSKFFPRRKTPSTRTKTISYFVAKKTFRLLYVDFGDSEVLPLNWCARAFAREFFSGIEFVVCIRVRWLLCNRYRLQKSAGFTAWIDLS